LKEVISLISLSKHGILKLSKTMQSSSFPCVSFDEIGVQFDALRRNIDQR